MRSGISVILVVVALCTFALAAQRPELFSPGDILIVSSGEPNDPNEAAPPAGEDPNGTWDPAGHLEADWDSIAVSMTSRLYNPAIMRSARAEGPQWSMSMTSTVYLTDPNGLVGWAWLPTSVLALDPEGRVVADSKTSGSLTRSYNQPVSRRPGARAYNPISLSLPIDPNAVYPDLLGRVEWTMNVLLAEAVTTVDIPLKAGETWVELTPGMEILVEEVTVAEGMYRYRVKVKYDPARVEYLTGGSFYLWRDDALPPAVVVKMDVLDAEGQSIRELSGGAFTISSSSAKSNNQTILTLSGNGACSECGTAATLRYTLALGMYEREVRLAVENVPVPEF